MQIIKQLPTKSTPTIFNHHTMLGLFYLALLLLLGLFSQAHASTCEAEPLQVDGEPELFGYNWELFDQAEIVKADEVGNALGVDYIEVVRGASDPAKAFAKTIQSFQRPVTVSADIRLKPESVAECLSLGVFGTPGCFAANPTQLYKCGYVGAPLSYGSEFSTQANEFGLPQIRTGVLTDKDQWHNVKIDLLQDGTTKFYLNDVLADTRSEPSTTQYGGSYNEGRITFYGCATGQYKNLKVVGNQCVTELASPLCEIVFLILNLILTLTTLCLC